MNGFSAALMARKYPANMAGVHSVVAGYFCLSHMAFKIGNFFKVFFGKFCKMVSLAMRPCAAPFFQHIVGIFLRRTKEKMVWIHANWVVASVANHLSHWNRPVR